MSNAKQGEYEKVSLTEIFAKISYLNSSPISDHVHVMLDFFLFNFFRVHIYASSLRGINRQYLNNNNKNINPLFTHNLV